MLNDQRQRHFKIELQLIVIIQKKLSHGNTRKQVKKSFVLEYFIANVL